MHLRPIDSPQTSPDSRARGERERAAALFTGKAHLQGSLLPIAFACKRDHVEMQARLGVLAREKDRMRGRLQIKTAEDHHSVFTSPEKAATASRLATQPKTSSASTSAFVPQPGTVTGFPPRTKLTSFCIGTQLFSC